MFERRQGIGTANRRVPLWDIENRQLKWREANWVAQAHGRGLENWIEQLCFGESDWNKKQKSLKKRKRNQRVAR